MNVLLLGSGGREHAFAWKLSQSRLLNNLFIAPGNGGTGLLGENIFIDVNDFSAVKSICLEKNIDMLVVGPENPLVKGIHDFFLADKDLKKIPVIGPKKAAARLEGSKDFAKKIFISSWNSDG
jgi:phosphoribosylamine--glycine ligase